MSPLELLIHLLNFAAPAFGLALLMVAFALIFRRSSASSPGLIAQAAINFVVGLVALTVGLWAFGRDGMVATYAALVLCVASSQWVIDKSWRL